MPLGGAWSAGLKGVPVLHLAGVCLFSRTLERRRFLVVALRGMVVGLNGFFGHHASLCHVLCAARPAWLAAPPTSSRAACLWSGHGIFLPPASPFTRHAMSSCLCSVFCVNPELVHVAVVPMSG